MMLPTHALVGMVLALPFTVVAPESAGVALAAGLLGGAVPDLDMYAGHRRTLHYPTYYAALAAAAVPVAVLSSSAWTVAVATFLLGAAGHSVSDVFGAGLELRPWEATSDRAVYDHWRGRWLAPRRWIRYDGAPEDLLAAVAVAGPLLVVLDGAGRRTVLALLGVGVVYALLRRRLPAVAERLVDGRLLDRLPERLVGHVPARYMAAKRESTQASTATPDPTTEAPRQ
jgi:hypothetical protein